MTPKQYAERVRQERVRKALRAAQRHRRHLRGGLPEPGAVLSAGQSALGMPPGDYKAGGAARRSGMLWRSARWAGLDRGDGARPLRDLSGRPGRRPARGSRRTFPSAQLVAADDKRWRMRRRNARYIVWPAALFQLPLDIQGTAFQQKVWAALRDIPVRRNGDLFGYCPQDRRTRGHARRRECLRGQPGRGCRSVPPRPARRRRHGRLPLGRAAQAALLERERGKGLTPPFHHHLLGLRDGLRRVQPLRTRLRAVHDGVAAIQPERVFELVEPVARSPRRGCPRASDRPAAGPPGRDTCRSSTNSSGTRSSSTRT